MIDPAQNLQWMRDLLDRVRRETPRFYLQAAIPVLKSYRGDALEQLWSCQNELLTQGKLVWGALIQANSALMMPGDFHLPGEVVCSPDPIFDTQPELLVEVASRIYDLKHTRPDDLDLRVVADHITDEMHRSLCERIPTQLTDGRVVVRYTVIFYREHLPTRMLGPSRLMPILVHGRHNLAMILPGPLWSPELKEDWKPNPEVLDAILRMQAADRAQRREGPVARITPAAVAAFRAAIPKTYTTPFVYISFQGGEKSVGVVDKKTTGDVETTVDGLRFLVEAETAKKYWGLQIDFVEADGQRGFIIKE
jgi:hypothetical protein